MYVFCPVIVRENDKVTRLYTGMNAPVIFVGYRAGQERFKAVNDYFSWLFSGKPYKVLKIRAFNS